MFEKQRHTFHSSEFQSVVNEAVEFFKNTPIHELPPHRSVSGLGVYGLYYVGDFPIYAPLGKVNRESETPIAPIYIGKAVPVGSRTGRIEVGATKSVRSRLSEHARSIQAVETQAEAAGETNLKITDFKCRFMILEDAEIDLIVPVESELIRRFQPLWNSFMSGVGNHTPGKGRLAQARSDWDVLHPGRGFAANLTGTASEMTQIEARVSAAMALLDSLK